MFLLPGIFCHSGGSCGHAFTINLTNDSTNDQSVDSKWKFPPHGAISPPSLPGLVTGQHSLQFDDSEYSTEVTAHSLTSWQHLQVAAVSDHCSNNASGINSMNPLGADTGLHRSWRCWLWGCWLTKVSRYISDMLNYLFRAETEQKKIVYL